jgi:sugar lactone lactonase YvrE
LNDAQGTSARFNQPSGIVISSTGIFYVADTNNNAIRRIDAGINVTTIAGAQSPGYIDGSALTARFNGPIGISIDNNNNLYVADTNNNSIRQIPSGFTSVVTFAGGIIAGNNDGNGTFATFNRPYNIVCDKYI